MKVLYKDKAGFAFVEEHLPWLNPAFISVDCLESLRRVDETTDVLLFSRGLLSTYVYNLPPLERNLGSRDSAFRLLDRLLTTMPTPDLVLYFDIPVDEAYRRVLKRSGTEPLRGRETLRGLAETHDLFEWILSQRRLRDLNMVRVDAALPEHDLTQTLIDHLVALLNERAGLRKSKG
jgi:thymidylate kinase